jgi:hypothetical protein
MLTILWLLVAVGGLAVLGVVVALEACLKERFLSHLVRPLACALEVVVLQVEPLKMLPDLKEVRRYLQPSRRLVVEADQTVQQLLLMEVLAVVLDQQTLPELALLVLRGKVITETIARHKV